MTSRPKSQARPLPRVLRSFVPIVTLTLCWSCGGGATDVPEDAAEREVFIGSFLDLRTAAVNSGSTYIEDDVRDSILTVNGVTGQDLLDFIDTHGDDVEYMSDLWTEVESRLTARLQRAREAEDEEFDETDEINGGDDGVSP